MKTIPKTILILAIAVAFVAGTAVSSPDVFAGKNDDKPKLDQFKVMFVNTNDAATEYDVQLWKKPSTDGKTALLIDAGDTTLDVQNGDTIIYDKSNMNKGSWESTTFYRFFDGNGFAFDIPIHTSCSKPLTDGTTYDANGDSKGTATDSPTEPFLQVMGNYCEADVPPVPPQEENFCEEVNLCLPEGPQGPDGATGPAGPQGPPGELSCEVQILLKWLLNQHPELDHEFNVDAECMVPAEEVPEDGLYRTQTQGGWGQGAQGNNPGSYRDACYTNIAPVVIGDLNIGFEVDFTTAAAIEAYLPDGGTPGVLDATEQNPTTTAALNLASQTTTLSISVAFDNFAVANENDATCGLEEWTKGTDREVDDATLAELVLQSGGTTVCDGLTVQEILNLANQELADGSTSFTPSELTACADTINNNFKDAENNNGNLVLP